ncbi:MAG: aminoacetone oxidase family FAD-binding enzyme, partial [Candidatus Gracilibacteria bacterium]
MKIAIIGAGAAGMMAAATISEKRSDAEVFLIEKNPEAGKKVMMTGGGRCNVTTGYTDMSFILSRYPRGGKFLNFAMRNFTPDQVRIFFESNGVPLKVEDDMRVFPVSDNSRDIVDVFDKIVTRNSNVHVILSRPVKTVSKEVGYRLDCGGLKIEVDKLILTTGGKADDGYSFAKSLGHHITPLAPSLSAFIIKEDWIKKLSGVSIEKASLKIVSSKKHEFTGPFVFTHTGMSGPAVLAMSSLMAFEDISETKPAKLLIDMVPDLPYPIFEEKFKKEVSDNPKKLFRKTVASFMPKSLADILCAREYLEKKNNAEVSKSGLNKMIEFIKHIPLTLIGRVPGEEF